MADTKKVSGENLASSAFAYVGDEKDKSTWKLPIEFKSEAKSKRHIRNAIARFDQTDMPVAAAKERAWKRIVAAAKEYGIQVADEQSSKKSGEVEMTRLLDEFGGDFDEGSSLADGLPKQTREFLIEEFRSVQRGVDDKGKMEKELIEGGDGAGKKPKGDKPASEDGRDEDQFDITLSSEFPVKQVYGMEILDHSPESVDLSRAKRGLSFLDSHETGSVIGLIENLQVQNRKLKGQLRFSRSEKAQDIKRDMQDGIRKFVSVGYATNEMQLESRSEENGDTYRATNWTPLEGSSVGVPGDPTVGTRAENAPLYPVKVRVLNQPAAKPNHVEDTVENVTVLQDSRNAAAEIVRLSKVHGIDQERVAAWIGEGKSVESASREILEDVAKRGAKPLAQPGAENEDRIELTEREQREYNVARGIMALVSNQEARQAGSAKRESSLELEISDHIMKNWTRESHGGLFVPWSIRHAMTAEVAKQFGIEYKKRAGLSTNVAGAGQELKFTEPGEFIQFLYNRLRIKELGAQTIAGLRDNVAFPKQTGKATGSWVGENPGVDVADSNLTLAQVASAPHTYQSSSSYSRQLLAQSVIDVDTLVREDLAKDIALSIDSVAITGTGSSNQPTGILHTTGVQAFTAEGDTGNGGPLDWNDVVKMTAALELVNADQLGEGGWLTTPGEKSLLKRTARLGNTVGLPIWADDDTVDGYMARSTNQVPSNGTKGTGSNLHTMIRGVFETMVIAMWGSGFELVVDPYRLKKQGMIELTTFVLVDIVLKYPVAFVAAQFLTD